MATDDYCRTHEKHALRFLMALGVTLTAIGMWNFEIDHLHQVSFHDWILAGFFPITLLYLRLKSKLIKQQAEDQGRDLSLVELDLKKVTDKRLIKQFRIVNSIMWGYAAVVLIIYFLSGNGLSI